MSVLGNILKATGNPLARPVEEGTLADLSGYIDTGAYSLNALLSADMLNGGMIDNRILVIAGDPSTGKTFFTMEMIRTFLSRDPNAMVVLFETEHATGRDAFVSRGIPVDRVAIVPVATVEGFRTQAMRVLAAYGETKEADRHPLMLVLDSLGNLSTNKEVNDIVAGEDKRDMTRAQLLKGLFRVLPIELGKYKVPMIVTNHVYSVPGANVPTKAQSGGTGSMYAASSVLTLTKAQDKNTTTGEVRGFIITCTMDKSRFSRERAKVKVMINFDRGLDRYYGLIDIALKHGIWKKLGNKIVVSEDSKHYESEIIKNPHKYFTPEVLDQLQEACRREFAFGSIGAEDEDVEEAEE